MRGFGPARRLEPTGGAREIFERYAAGTEVLRNLSGIRDPQMLAAFEANVTAARLAELGGRPAKGGFDSAHVKAIHRFIFQEVFSWAGEFRTVNISLQRAAIRGIGVGRSDAEAGCRERVGGPQPRGVFAARWLLPWRDQRHPSFPTGQRADATRVHAASRGAMRVPVAVDPIARQQMIDASIQSFRHGDNAGLAAIILIYLEH